MENNLPKVSYRSTIGQLEDFKSSAIWHDIQQEIQVWVERARNALETDLDPINTAFVRGCVKAARDLLTVVDVLQDVIDQQNTEERNEREN